MVNVLFFCMALLVFMMGASVFSFLNVVAYRSVKKESYIKGRSYCPECGHELAAKDLIPVISFITLAGKCRYCKKPIPVRDTIFEIVGGLLLLATLIKAVTDANFDLYTADNAAYCKLISRVVVMFLFFSMLDVVSLIDMAIMEIKNRHVAIVFAIAVAAVFVMPEITLAERVIGAFSVSIPMLVIALIIPGGFGGGDIKFMVPVGFMLGFKLALTGFFFAILGGGIYGVFLLATKRADKKSHFAFGPFLCLGMTISLLFGGRILNAYFGMFRI